MDCTSYNTNTSGQVTLTAGTLPGGFCPANYQALLNAFAQYTTASLQGSYSTFIISSTEPASTDRDKLWLKVESDCQPVGFFLYFNGGWVLVGENLFYGEDNSGTANTVTCTTTQNVNFLEAGQVFMVKIANTNTGASTFAPNGLAADDIKKAGAALTGNEMLQGGVAVLCYVGTHYELTNPQPDTVQFIDGFWNGSFETDTNGDLIPDRWTRALIGTGVDGDNVMWDDDQVHGEWSFKTETAGGGAGSGGSSLTCNDYLLVDKTTPYFLSWWMKADDVAMHNWVEVLWYDADKEAVSTVTVWDNLTTNPTAWKFQRIFLAPPATATFMRVRLTGGVQDSAQAGITLWDDFRVERAKFPRKVDFTAAGTYEWMAPVSGWAKVTCVGGGGGGAGGSTGLAGSGGGGGGRATSAIQIVIGTIYTIVVGAGGAGGGGGAAGSNGNSSTWETNVVIGSAGTGGAANAGAVGVGGSGTGQFIDAGGNGQVGDTRATYGGNGGSSAFGCGGYGIANTAGTAGVEKGGGGAGSVMGAQTGGAGAAGYVSIEW